MKTIQNIMNKLTNIENLYVSMLMANKQVFLKMKGEFKNMFRIYQLSIDILRVLYVPRIFTPLEHYCSILSVDRLTY